MYEADREAFSTLMTDLCRSVNRPMSAEMLRVFWEDLQHVPFPQVQRQATSLRTKGKRNFNSNDLRPPPDERAAIGGPDNAHLLNMLSDHMNRHLWNRLTDMQRSLGQFQEFVWTNDRIAPRPVALVIKADGDSPGHRINVIDCSLDPWDEPKRDSAQQLRDPGSDDEFDEAAAARDLLSRSATKLPSIPR